MKNNNEHINELVHSISCDIHDDFEVHTGNVRFEVWSTGIKNDKIVFDTEMLLATFYDPDLAEKYVDKLTLADIVHMAADNDTGFYTDVNIDTIQVEVETVVDLDDTTATNVGTLKAVYIPVEDELTSPAYEYPTIELSNDDYTLLEDGTLKVPSKLVSDLSEGDYVVFKFIEENHPALTYRVIHKILSNGQLWTCCEFVL